MAVNERPHTGLPVAGYTPQSAAAVDAVNANKRLEETVLRQLDRLAQSGMCDPRWLAIGRTDIEKGFMAINRVMFRPSEVRRALPARTFSV